MRLFFRLRDLWLLTALLFPLCPGPDDTAWAQSGPTQTEDPRMVPSPSQKIGELRHGELLLSAMKREKADAESARLAIHSLSKLLDFRLSRSGDKYILQLAPNRKVTLLRYQRGQHVYEATLQQDGTYLARLVERQNIPEQTAPQMPPVPNTVQPTIPDEDGEIDVEHADIAAKLPADDPLQALDIAPPDAPILPTDPVLDGIPSPDEEFPDSPPENDPPNPENDTPTPQAMPQRRPNEAPTTASLQNADILPVQIRCRQDDANPQVAGIVMLVLGSTLFLLGLVFGLGPAIRARMRISRLSLHICDSIQITPQQRLFCIDYQGSKCLILVQRDKMQFVAPCPLDSQECMDFLQSRTYWHEMAQHPLSDRQLAAFLHEFHANPSSVNAPNAPNAPEENEEA